jgi:mRNA-degrading endonuclease RelE of RelBE toxin-antitoxin system
MRYEIKLAPQAVEDLRALRANIRAEVRDGIERHLRHEPQRTSKARIKRLKGVRRPEYRLRIGDVRVFYDVRPGEVWVVAIAAKEGAEEWLRRAGK